MRASVAEEVDGGRELSQRIGHLRSLRVTDGNHENHGFSDRQSKVTMTLPFVPGVAAATRAS